MSSQKTEVPVVVPVAGISMEQLMEIVKAIKAPPEKTPEQLAVEHQARQMREDRAKMELEAIERRRQERLYCSHQRTDGTYNVIYIYPSTPDMFRFVFCQACAAIIRPESEKPTDPGKLQDAQEHIFDTRLFNQLFRQAVRPKTDF